MPESTRGKPKHCVTGLKARTAFDSHPPRQIIDSKVAAVLLVTPSIRSSLTSPCLRRSSPGSQRRSSLREEPLQCYLLLASAILNNQSASVLEVAMPNETDLDGTGLPCSQARSTVVCLRKPALIVDPVFVACDRNAVDNKRCCSQVCQLGRPRPAKGDRAGKAHRVWHEC